MVGAEAEGVLDLLVVEVDFLLLDVPEAVGGSGTLDCVLDVPDVGSGTLVLDLEREDCMLRGLILRNLSGVASCEYC